MFAMFTRERTFESSSVKVAVRTANIANIGPQKRKCGKKEPPMELTGMEGRACAAPFNFTHWGCAGVLYRKPRFEVTAKEKLEVGEV